MYEDILNMCLNEKIMSRFHVRCPSKHLYHFKNSDFCVTVNSVSVVKLPITPEPET